MGVPEGTFLLWGGIGCQHKWCLGGGVKVKGYS